MATKAAKLLDTPSFQPRFTFLRRIFRILSIIFAKGNGTCWWPYLLLILFSGLSEVVTYFSGKSISLFYLYLTSKDANQFHILLGTMTGYYIAGSFLRGLTSYASGLFALRARNRLSLILHTYMIQRIDLDIDNPDQRITQDVDRLAESLRIILESLVIDPPLIILYSYQTAMVGGTVNLFGPGMIYLYFFFSCVVCRIAIGPLIQLICKREEKEGDYRALHIRFREYEQSIRQSCGCHYETLVVDQCLEALLALQHRILLFNIPLKTILEFINFFGGILSYALIAIPIFSGELDNKTPSELSALISESSFVCMYLIYRFTMITALSDVFSEVFGYTARVGQMIDILDNELQKPKAFDSVVVFPYEPVSSLNISIKNMTVEIPNVFSIIENLSLELTPGTNLIIKGKNGSGKTTLFNALTNLSIPKSGSSTIPQFPNTLVMPQKLYLPCIASISEIVGYGCSCRGVCGKGCMGFKSFSSSEITRVLNEVGLAYLPRQVTSIDSSKSLFEKFKLDVLSNGEVQRLYIARILLWKPSWAFIDEGLSAVDSSGRMLLYGLLRKADVSLVIIDHHLDESLDGKWTSIVLNKA